MKKHSLLKRIISMKMFYLFIAPAIIFFLIFIAYPLVNGFLMSMQKYGLMGSMGYIGMDNYEVLVQDKFFLKTITNTLKISIGIVTFGVTIPIIISLGINELVFKRFKRTVQTLIFVPYLFSWVIIIGIFLNLFSPTGAVNSFLVGTGITETFVGFFTTEKYARPMLILLTVWKDIGYTTLIYLAGLSTVDQTLYETASIDGANFFQRSRYVSLPALVPTIKIMTIMILMGSLRTFDQSLLLANSSVYREVTSVVVYAFEKGVLKFELGIATASASIVFIGTLLLVLIVKRIIRYQ
ncbi:ABC transporter permease subunit [Vallitaleaceae bacterium 9-2]